MPSVRRSRSSFSFSLPFPLSDVPSSSLAGPSISGHATGYGTTSSGHCTSIDEDDIVIAVMGPTGSGKSSFVNTAAGRAEAEVGKDLRSRTRAVQPVRCHHPDGHRAVVLVDTPGCNDTELPDTQVLRIIARWLKETYQSNVRLTGLLYLHRISDVRMGGTCLRDLSVFKSLCGDDNLKNVVFVTTMWDELQNESVGLDREKQLFTDFWKEMIDRGSHTRRFEGTRESAWGIIDRLDLERSHQTRMLLKIQDEMVNGGLQLHQTTAAKTLHRFFDKLAGEFKKAWGKLWNRTRRTTSLRTFDSLEL